MAEWIFCSIAEPVQFTQFSMGTATLQLGASLPALADRRALAPRKLVVAQASQLHLNLSDPLGPSSGG